MAANDALMQHVSTPTEMILTHVAVSTLDKSAVWWQELWMDGAQRVTVMTRQKRTSYAKETSVTPLMRMIR